MSHPEPERSVCVINNQRALVLGGGGITGIGWELGVLAGLAEQGVDLTDADLVVGTSAGSVVGAQITSGVGLEELYARQVTPPDGELAAAIGKTGIALAASALIAPNVRSARRWIGRLALAAKTVPEAHRLAVVRSRLPRHDWPADGRLRTTAVDTATGDFATFGSDSGVPLVNAVAASCAVPGVWPPVTINGRRWMDGGVRSMCNADVAHRCRRIVILAPLGTGTTLVPGARQQAAQLRRKGAHVVVVEPDGLARQSMGRNPLDPAYRVAATQAGRKQASALLARARTVWNAGRAS
jgi:NTE family protein